MNNSVYEQIFWTQSVSDDVLCLELLTRKPSTSWSNKLGVSAIVKEISSEEEEGREDVPASLIHGICAKWGEVQSFVERYHPDKAVVSRSINIFKDNAMCHFRNILKRRQKQITMDNFLVRQRPSGSEAETSDTKRQKKEKESPSKQ